VTRERLRELGLVQSNSELVKVLGRGEITKPLTVRVHKFSAKAAEKIVAAGGVAETVA
jgi:large subunit ribosomal protein L15